MTEDNNQNGHVRFSAKSYVDEQMEALKGSLVDKMNERGARYEVMFSSVFAALASAKEAVATALTAAKEAVSTALAAAKEAVSAALASQEKALVLAKREADAATEKLSEALLTYKASQNEWQKTFADYRAAVKADTLSRGETLAMFDKHLGLIQKVEEDVSKIQIALSRGEGGAGALESTRAQSNWKTGTILTVVGLVVTLIVMGGLELLTLIAGLVYFLVGH